MLEFEKRLIKDLNKKKDYNSGLEPEAEPKTTMWGTVTTTLPLWSLSRAICKQLKTSVRVVSNFCNCRKPQSEGTDQVRNSELSIIFDELL